MPDASLPQFNPSPIGPNIGQSIAAANSLLQFQQNQQQVQRQNALRTILGTPGAIDATGQPTPETMTRVMGVDPNTGLQLQQNALVNQQRKLQVEALTSKTAVEATSTLDDAYSPILLQYKQNIASGMPPAAAQQQAQEATTSTTERLKTGGMLPPTFTQNLPTQFDLSSFERMAMHNGLLQQWQKDRITEQKTQFDEGVKAKQLEIQEREAGFKNLGNPVSVQYKGPDGQPVQTMAVYDKANGQWLTADGRKPIQGDVTPMKPLIPGSQAATRAAIADDINNDPEFKDAPPGRRAEELETRLKIAQGTMSTPEAQHSLAESIASYQLPPLSGFALSRPEGQRIQAEITRINPEYQATEFNNYNKTISGFGAGKQGDTIRYINNAIQHIDVMQKAADALGSGDMRTFNTLANAIGKEFGVAAPTTFDGLRQIVGTEIERAATGGVGAAVDRQNLIESLNKANSPEQLKDVFKNFKALFGGQAASLKTQYEDGTPDRPSFRGDGQFSFDKKLLPQTRKELPGFDQSPSAPRKSPGASLPPAQQDTGLTAGAKATPEQLKALPKPKSPDDAHKLAPGTAFVLPDNTIGIVPQPVAAAAPAPAPSATPAAQPSAQSVVAPPAVPGGPVAQPAATPTPAAAQPAPSPGTAAAPLPLTKGMKQTDLAVGKIYNTRYGPMSWDGKNFVAVQ